MVVPGLELTAEIVPMGPGSMRRAAELVRGGRVIAYPTDTVYGLGCDPFSEPALKRLFEAKGRGAKAVPVLCSSAAKAEEVVGFSERARSLATANWPGALTIVAPLKRAVPHMLTQGSGALGVRVPAHPPCLKLGELCGGWLTGTSANVSGRPSANTAEDAGSQLGSAVDLVLDGGVRGGRESTVERVVGEEVTILRTGPVGVKTE